MSDLKEKMLGRFGEIIELHTAIPNKDLRYERFLMMSKWYQYRFMSPHDATRLFAQVYETQFTQLLKDTDKMPHGRATAGVNWRLFNEKASEYVQLWHARQSADEVGIPYERYIEFSLGFAMRRSKRLEYYPRPNQLRSTGKSNIAWVKKLHEFKKAREYVCRPIDPGSYSLHARCDDTDWTPCYEYGSLFSEYRTENYIGLPAQDAFREFAMQRALERPGSLEAAFRLWSHEWGLVPMAMFKSRLGEERFREALASVWQARRRGESKRQCSSKRFVEDLLPCCFGIPGARDTNDPACANCLLGGICDRAAGYVSRELEKRHGSTDPVTFRRRTLARDRKRRFDAKKRGELGSTHCSS